MYDGEFKDGNKHGRGTYTLKNGGVYDGEFKDDIKHGRGTLKYANGEEYDREWEDGKHHGRVGEQTRSRSHSPTCVSEMSHKKGALKRVHWKSE